MVYLQKASLKAAGLVSREKAMVISGEDHLRCKRCSRDKTKKKKDSRKGKSIKRGEDMEQRAKEREKRKRYII